MYSCTVLTGTLALTARILGTTFNSATASRSLSASYDILEYSDWLIAVEIEPTNKV
ncbi:hypothetical protein D3C85_1254600 [compost metagenome]